MNKEDHRPGHKGQVVQVPEPVELDTAVLPRACIRENQNYDHQEKSSETGGREKHHVHEGVVLLKRTSWPLEIRESHAQVSRRRVRVGAAQKFVEFLVIGGLHAGGRADEVRDSVHDPEPKHHLPCKDVEVSVGSEDGTDQTERKQGVHLLACRSRHGQEEEPCQNRGGHSSSSSNIDWPVEVVNNPGVGVKDHLQCIRI
mmetsp:Transcript_65559/g.142963  ORF Transcript_65559/g.142963 Transcript_65559/m.142963 type:complete len:200 (+) Transcript_65559:1557-2156(+)